jgi:hypothetical protein
MNLLLFLASVNAYKGSFKGASAAARVILSTMVGLKA